MVFRSLEDIVRAQNNAIKSLEKAIEQRPSPDDVCHISRKCTRSDQLHKSLSRVSLADVVRAQESSQQLFICTVD